MKDNAAGIQQHKNATSLLKPVPHVARMQTEKTHDFILPRSIGNHGVSRQQNGESAVQTKLKVGPVDDVYEREADRVAEEVVRTPAQPASVEGVSEPGIQRKCAACEQDKELSVRRKPQSGETGSGAGMADHSVSGLLPGSGRPLQQVERGFFESRFGQDFSNVRIHTGNQAVLAAQSINAKAFTVGNHIAFGAGEYNPESVAGKKLLAHELTHTLQQSKTGRKIQRAETDDNPRNCFPPGGTPLQDSASHINAWVRGARARSSRDAIHMVNAVYQELASGGSVSEVERRLGALPATHVRHVDYDRSRYAGTMMWPVDPLTRSALWAAGKIFVAPVINLCGTCVGTDKVGHFFQQGYEYFRFYQLIKARLEGMSEADQRAFYRRITGPPVLPEMSLGIEVDREPFGLGSIQVTPAAIVEFAASAFTEQYGRWLEGFNNTLNADDVRWIRGQSFTPFYYSEGVYGAASTGVLSRADLQANRMGFQFYRDLWHNSGSVPDICDYVGGLWNEHTEVNSVVPMLGTPRGPVSHSLDVETP